MGLFGTKQTKFFVTIIIIPAIGLLTILQFIVVGRHELSFTTSSTSTTSSFWGIMPKDVWLDISNTGTSAYESLVVMGGGDVKKKNDNNTTAHVTEVETTTKQDVSSSQTPPTLKEATTKASSSSSSSAQQQQQQQLPTWITNYVKWHNDIRKQYPGTKLFTDPNAPNILLRVCVSKCGGLHDRLGKLPWDLYIANQTNRILMIHWCFPSPLETFLQPNVIDWSFIPPSLGGGDGSNTNETLGSIIPAWDDNPKKTCGDNVNSLLNFFENYSDGRPGSKFFDHQLEDAIERANTDPTYKNAKILRHRILGLDTELVKRLKALNETDTIVGTRTTTTEQNQQQGGGGGSLPSYGQIFSLFFKPSSGLQTELEETMNQHNLFPGEYSAVHCRVRHPKAYPRGTLSKQDAPGGPDRLGLLFDGPGKDYAIDTATKAIKCAQKAFLRPKEPIYFYADSEDLVKYVTDLSEERKKRKIRNSPNVTKTEINALGVTQNTQIVSRPITTETLHIDRQVAADPSMFYGSFVDLLIGAHARCVAYGVGNYAYFAAKLSGTPCGYLHQKGAWDPYDHEKVENSKLCPKI